jgi:hypothetical protein
MVEREKQKPEGTGLVISTENISDRETLMAALNQFEYGNEEESEEGFNKLSEIANPQNGDGESEGRKSSASKKDGWKQVEGEPKGVFTTDEQSQDFTTSDFAKYAEESRARWDFGEWLKIKLQHFLHKK